MQQRRARTSATFLLGVLTAAVIAVFVSAPPSGAQEAALGPAQETVGSVSNLPLPRYVSLRSSEINVRRGPGLDYRKDWVFRRAGLPVRIVDEYGDWRRIVDKDDAGGWVFHAMLTGRRTVLVVDDRVTLRREPDDAASAAAVAEQGVVAILNACRPEWCEIQASGYSGWVRKASLWGVDPSEVVED